MNGNLKQKDIFGIFIFIIYHIASFSMSTYTLLIPYNILIQHQHGGVNTLNYIECMVIHNIIRPTTNIKTPKIIYSLQDIRLISYGCNGEHFTAKNSQNQIFVTGNNNSGQLGTGIIYNS